MGMEDVVASQEAAAQRTYYVIDIESILFFNFFLVTHLDIFFQFFFNASGTTRATREGPRSRRPHRPGCRSPTARIDRAPLPQLHLVVLL